MKPRTAAISFFLFLIFFEKVNAQHPGNTDFKSEIVKYDLAKVWTPDSITDGEEFHDRQEPLGYIDTNYQRFYIHYIEVVKRIGQPLVYDVTGKTRLKHSICRFTGTITITKAEIGAIENSYREGFVEAAVKLYEDSSDVHSGFIYGTLISFFEIDSLGKFEYDALWSNADDYYNNQFQGSWTSYKTGKMKKCNWGDFRIPDSHDLDCGVGYFLPSDIYLKNGWENYRKADIGFIDDPKRLKAEKIENEEWWK